MPEDVPDQPGNGNQGADAGEGRKKGKKKNLLEGWVPKERPNRRNKLEFFQIQQHDFVREATRKNIWYYRDRLSVPRGPCPLPVLRECWVNGIIDENTLVWGQGLMDWLPAKNVRTLVAQIRTPEVQFGAWMKRTFALKPALRAIRRKRPEHRTVFSDQVDDMR